MKIRIKKLNPSAKIPFKSTEEAGCYDIVATDITHLAPNKVIVKLGFSTEIEKGWKAVIVPRSSFTHKSWVLQNTPAQIDSDYRGEWMLKFEAIPTSLLYKMDNHNRATLGYDDFPYELNDKVAQMTIEKVEDIDWEVTDDLNTTTRNSGGFGSTGR